MDYSFIIKLLVSFFVGGIIISALSFLAEITNENISGIILGFPATLALGLFFLAWTTSSETVSNVIPAVFIPLGLSVLFVVIYLYTALYLSNTIKHKSHQVLLSTIISIGFWLAFSIPLALLKINNIFIGIAGYILLALVSHHILKKNHYNKVIVLYDYSSFQKIIRAVFSGFIVFLVVLLGGILDPFWSGIFSIFPITLVSSIVILHWYYEPKQLFPMMKKTAIGSLSIFFYIISVMITYPIFGFIIGTLISYLVSMIVILLLIKLQNKTPIPFYFKDSRYEGIQQRSE